jgi:tetrapyrrole methylase family protein/MazG family protein
MGERDFNSLIELVATLRSPEGCPWDREQTHDSLTGFLIEESYEVVQAIECHDAVALKYELGDLLLHIAFHIQLAKESGEFDETEVLNAIHDKMIQRHPHVFGESDTKDISEVKLNWETLKSRESEHIDMNNSPLPSLVRARKTFDKAENLSIKSRQLYDEIDDNIRENLTELIEDEPKIIGSLLMLITELAHERNIEPEIELKNAVDHAADQMKILSNNASPST